jgi:hypothetical protein
LFAQLNSRALSITDCRSRKAGVALYLNRRLRQALGIAPTTGKLSRRRIVRTDAADMLKRRLRNHIDQQRRGLLWQKYRVGSMAGSSTSQFQHPELLLSDERAQDENQRHTKENPGKRDAGCRYQGGPRLIRKESATRPLAGFHKCSTRIVRLLITRQNTNHLHHFECLVSHPLVDSANQYDDQSNIEQPPKHLDRNARHNRQNVKAARAGKPPYTGKSRLSV